MKELSDYLSEQAIELVFHYLVTLADGAFQLLSVENLDMPTDVTDRSTVLQTTGATVHLRGGRLTYRQSVLRHDQLIYLQTVVAQQEPAAKLLFD